MNAGSSLTIVLLAGSSLIACPAIIRNDFDVVSILPASFYLNAESFSDNYGFQTRLLSEELNSLHEDATIEIPVVKKVKFRVGKPSPMNFTL